MDTQVLQERSTTVAETVFQLPAALEASEPPEARGLARDEVRLMVTYRSDNRIVHARFHDVVSFLREGDVVVINTSGTRPAALQARRADGSRLSLHLSTQLPVGLWLVELRQPSSTESGPSPPTEAFFGGEAGERLALPQGGYAVLKAPYGGHRRLWVASVCLPLAVDDYLGRHGRPIRYGYVTNEWPLAYYQTVYATEPGSAEMPSAGRAFTTEIITRLVARGVLVVPLVLHTGVASQEAGEKPYEEYYHVPEATARVINSARAAGSRVIAVGTTVVRALETVADESGRVRAAEGWTGLVVTAQRGVRAVDGLLTGWHEAEASHLAILEALAGKDHLQMAYGAALCKQYLWHEFGDLHLILP